MLSIILLTAIFTLAYKDASREKKEEEQYTASMRYLWPTLSLIVAVVLIQDCPCPLSGEASFLPVS